jgi:hypothetical protein
MPPIFIFFILRKIKKPVLAQAFFKLLFSFLHNITPPSSKPFCALFEGKIEKR